MMVNSTLEYSFMMAGSAMANVIVAHDAYIMSPPPSEGSATAEGQ